MRACTEINESNISSFEIDMEIKQMAENQNIEWKESWRDEYLK